MGFNAEWTNADALAFRPYTAYASAPVTYSATTNPMSDLQRENSKLRELVKRYHHLVTGTDELWSWQSVYEQLRELGIEVSE